MVDPEHPQAAVSLPELVTQRASWRAAGQRVVLTNGCFDILHSGHVALIEAARREGDRLVVAINSDRSVAKLKGAGRPLLPEAERAEALRALESVDAVVIYDEETPLGVVQELRPDVLVKGADWGQDEIVGRVEVEQDGGRVVRVALVPDRSTSAIVARIRRP